jgi:flagellar motility protein MotE (MotC chaperone)
MGQVQFVPPALGEMTPVEMTAAQSVEERRIAVAIQAQRDQLAAREEAIRQREMELKKLADEVDRKLTDLSKVRAELQGLFQEVNAEEQQRLRKLSAMYGKMEPEQAAKILDGLDKQLAVEILSGIKDKSAGRILASMDQKRAAQLTRGISKITPY